MTATRKRGQRLGWVGYAKVLRHLQLWESTAEQVGGAMCMSTQAAQRLLRRMHAVRLIRISRWSRSHVAQQRVAVWAFGGGPDAAYPGEVAPKPPDRTKNLSAQLIAFASFIRALDLAKTVRELADLTGCDDQFIARVLERMRALNLARVADWSKPEASGPRSAMWELGSGSNAPRPPRVPRREIDAKYWAENKTLINVRRRLRRRELRAQAQTVSPQEVCHA